MAVPREVEGGVAVLWVAVWWGRVVADLLDILWGGGGYPAVSGDSSDA